MGAALGERARRWWVLGYHGKSLELELIWRGDVWPVPIYQIASGLADYVQRSVAGMTMDKAIEIV